MGFTNPLLQYKGNPIGYLGKAESPLDVRVDKSTGIVKIAIRVQ